MSSTTLGGILADAAMPVGDPISQLRRSGYKEGTDPQEGHITQTWEDWLTSVTSTVSRSSTTLASLDTSSAVSIGATDITNGNIAAGIYRFTYYVSITTPGGAGTVTVTLDWTEDGKGRQTNGVGIDSTDNTASEQGGGLIKSDGASPIRYSAVVAAVPPPVFTLVVILETAGS